VLVRGNEGHHGAVGDGVRIVRMPRQGAEDHVTVVCSRVPRRERQAQCEERDAQTWRLRERPRSARRRRSKGERIRS
jgi:hypothetical protein